MSLERNIGAFDFSGTAVPARAAATVVVARPAGASFEVLLLERPPGDTFAARQSVFPGGKVDRADLSDAAAAVCPVDADVWAIGPLAEAEPAGRAGFLRAALRELWEEAGILPQGAPPGDWPRSSAEGFWSALAQAGARLSSDAISYWVNWVTPKPIPMRFDTHFFLARVDHDACVRPQEGEVVAARWFHPAEALDACCRGEIELMFPTLRSLEHLAGAATIADLVRVVAQFPKMRVEPHMGLDPDGSLSLTMPEGWPEPPDPIRRPSM